MTVTTVFQRGIKGVLLLGFMVAITACGGGGGSSTGSSPKSSSLASSSSSSAASSSSSSAISTFLMGGAVQGRPLNIATVVSTLAGAAQGADGLGAAARFNLPSAIVRDGDNLFVADTGNNTIRKIDISTGVVTTLAGKLTVSGSDDGVGDAAHFSRPTGLTSDGTNLYVADISNNNIRKIVIATGVVTTFAGTADALGSGSTDGNGKVARFNEPSDITTDGTNLYVADARNSTIRKIVIATGNVSTFAGSAATDGNRDGTGTDARFSYPCGITTDNTYLYVADCGNDTIRKIVITTGEVTTLAGTAGTRGHADGTGRTASFYHPLHITTDGANLYVTDINNSTIRKIIIATGSVTTFAGTAGILGSADGTATAASFNSPYGITTDGTNIYVADSNNSTIRKIVIATGEVTTLAGMAKTYGSGSTDGTGVAASFFYPNDITTDGTNLYVADTSNNTIRKIVIATGEVTTLAGTARVYGYADGTGATASFDSPNGITTDGTNLYVADTINSTIRKIVIATGEVTTLAGTARVYGYADGTGATASFNAPHGITTDSTNLYVTDSNNSTIRKIVIATGAVTTLAGTAGADGHADGTGAAANFDGPQGITTDGTYLYVADTTNGTIRKIVIATGEVTTPAGTARVHGHADGTGAAARFDFTNGITTDGTNLYVTDAYTIRKIVITTGVVTTLGGRAGVDGSADGVGTAASFYHPSGITTDGFELFVTDNFNSTIRKIH